MISYGDRVRVVKSGTHKGEEGSVIHVHRYGIDDIPQLLDVDLGNTIESFTSSQLEKLEDDRISLDRMYMNIAQEVAKRSSCERKKVGAVAVKDGIIAEGYNGCLPKRSNQCEDLEGNTKDVVRHSEANIISKLAKSTNSADGATLYITMSPCFDCACNLIICGFERVVYKEEYRDTRGIEVLVENGIEVDKI